MDEHPRSVCRPQREALEQCLEPRSSLGDVAARAPEPQQVHRKAEACIRVTVMLAPVECHAKVPELTLQGWPCSSSSNRSRLLLTNDSRPTRASRFRLVSASVAPRDPRLGVEHTASTAASVQPRNGASLRNNACS